MHIALNTQASAILIALVAETEMLHTHIHNAHACTQGSAHLIALVAVHQTKQTCVQPQA